MKTLKTSQSMVLWGRQTFNFCNSSTSVESFIQTWACANGHSLQGFPSKNDFQLTWNNVDFWLLKQDFLSSGFLKPSSDLAFQYPLSVELHCIFFILQTTFSKNLSLKIWIISTSMSVCYVWLISIPLPHFSVSSHIKAIAEWGEAELYKINFETTLQHFY